MPEHTRTQTPPLETSDEAQQDQLALARKQGDALEEAAQEMLRREATSGKEGRAGDYLVAVAIEEAEGMWRPLNGKLEWQDPQEENCHIEVLVRDAADGRFVPGLTVHVAVTDPDGNGVGTHEHPLLWHPWLHHYGRNWKVPRDGEYTIRVRIDTPTFGRHDKVNGKRYLAPADIEFTGMKIKTGQKKS